MPEHETRRRILSVAGLAAVGALAGCSAGQADAEPDGDGSTSNEGDSDDGDSMVVYRSGDVLEVGLTADGVTPASAEIAAGARVVLTVSNDDETAHVIGLRDGSEARFETEPGVDPARAFEAPPDQSRNVLWTTPERPGEYLLRCRTHDRGLVAIRVVPADASSGCPSG